MKNNLPKENKMKTKMIIYFQNSITKIFKKKQVIKYYLIENKKVRKSWLK